MPFRIEQIEHFLRDVKTVIDAHEVSAADILPVIRLHPGESLSVGEALSYILDEVEAAHEAELPLDPPF